MNETLNSMCTEFDIMEESIGGTLSVKEVKELQLENLFLKQNLEFKDEELGFLDKSFKHLELGLSNAACPNC